ncbi:hypothetical protein SCLCIDRAFT_29409 [Scleroderma citrinum Foug A]|uniref:Uncharacterized protein n=1 Tax=Scleroderma citrinum Foug A TaxID=1036808 RepID=A0A0C3D7E7_9AGAM|nr:hypothetical protein SCLCIDRAFT_29409 [Scleroderma citrinum Foug A]
MGIIALESSLDTAVRILDYRLSCTTDNVTRTIYTYRISLLKEKIAKTHKKFTTSVSSPVSVSPNKYTSLVVEDVDTQYATDCVDTREQQGYSGGVPKSSSAPDVKRGVFNSHVSINGQNSSSLASSDSESPADDLEVGFLVELRGTITMEYNESQEMWIQALKNHESKGDVDESTLEEAQKLVPHEYLECLDVFSKLKSECMLLRKPWDHGIDLKEDFPLKKG